MIKKLLFFTVFLFCAASLLANIDPYKVDPNPPKQIPGYKLVWSDEFNYTGKPSPANWSYETGFVRNEEHQWYQEDNAICANGALQITARKERFKNPNYQSGSSNWKTNREYVEYTSSAIHGRGKQSFLYGRFEIRAKIPAMEGCWPAIWTLGSWGGDWPNNGEIDILEYYREGILANACWGSNQDWTGIWDSTFTPMSHFTSKDSDWRNKYHIWVMDWTPEFIKIYLDGELLNTIELAKTKNAKNGENPFKLAGGHYVLLNLAIGGQNGGNPAAPNYPVTYFVDYVRVYQVDSDYQSCFEQLDADKNLAPDPECNRASPYGTGERIRTVNNMKVYCGDYSVELKGGSYLQPINWEAGASYRVRAMVYANGDDVILGAKGFGEGNDYNHPVNTNLNTWQQIDFVFTAPEHVESGSGVFLTGTPGSMIDNVEVYKLEDEFVEVSRSMLHFDKTNYIKSFRVTAYQLNEALELTAPAGVSLSQSSITPEEAKEGKELVVTFDKTTQLDQKSISISNSKFNYAIQLSSELNEYEDNLAANWDARGVSGVRSKPDVAGWLGAGSVNWEVANSSSVGAVRFNDYTTSDRYMYHGEKFVGRLLHVRWDSGVNPENCFAYPVKLEKGKTYTISGLYGWQANGGDYSIYTIGLNTDANNKGVSYATLHKTIYKNDKYQLYDFTFVFTAPEDNVYYLTFTNTEKIMGAVGNISVQEGLVLPPELDVNLANLTFSEGNSLRNIFLSGANLTENIEIILPENITLNESEITPDDLNGKLRMLLRVEFDGKRDIENEQIEFIYKDIKRIINVSAEAFGTSIKKTNWAGADFHINFVDDAALMEFVLPVGGEVLFELYSLQGQLVNRRSVFGVAGDNQLTMPITLVSGAYLMKMSMGGQALVKKIVKL